MPIFHEDSLECNSQFALLHPLCGLGHLLRHRGLELLPAKPDGDKGVIGTVLPLDLQSLRSLH